MVSTGSTDVGTDDARARWQARYDAARVREADFTTLSGMVVEPAYGPVDGAAGEWPGEFPFTRGLYPLDTAAGRGRSGSSPASATPSRPTSATG